MREGGTKQSNNRKGIPIGKADRVTQAVGMLAIGFVVALFKYTVQASWRDYQAPSMFMRTQYYSILFVL